MSAAVVAIGIASIFVGAFIAHLNARRKRAKETATAIPALPEFRPEPQMQRRIQSSNIKWEI